MKIGKFVSALIISVCAVYAYLQGGVWCAIGGAAAAYVIYDFFTQEKCWLPIGELALLMGAIQWIISPFFSYFVPSLYEMSQSCGDYMSYTVPMYLAFMFGYYYFRSRLTLQRDDLIKYSKNAGKISDLLIWTGFLFMIIPSVPAVFGFVKVLLSYLFFVGIIMRMYVKPKRSTLYMLLAVCVQLFHSIAAGMFHELIVWGIFLLLTWFNVNKITLKKRILIIVVSLFGVFVLQTVKTAYREVIWKTDYSGSKIELFVTLLLHNAVNVNTAQGDKASSIDRYNQGWIISRIYSHVPAEHGYFYGRTYFDAVKSALLPRFLVPGKKGAGEQSRQDFIEMTGYQLSSNTSMGLSILGESYGNFGLCGGILFMLFWGFVIAKVVAFVNELSTRNFMWIIFLPIISYDLIKAEISMMSVLNWTVKAVIFVLLIMLFLKILYPKTVRYIA